MAGNNNREQQMYGRSIEQHSGQNIFSGFNNELLSEALGVNALVAKRLQGQNDQRGEIIRVKNGLKALRPLLHNNGTSTRGNKHKLNTKFSTVKNNNHLRVATV